MGDSYQIGFYLLEDEMKSKTECQKGGQKHTVEDLIMK